MHDPERPGGHHLVAAGSAEAPDADHCDDPTDVTDPDGPQPPAPADSGAETPISLTEAEDEVARAEARAEAARARVTQLRRAAETADAEEDDDVSNADEQRAARSSRSRPRWLRRPGRKAVAVGAAAVLACASVGASGYMVWQHHTMMHKRQLTQEYAAAARQAVSTLMSIDANHAKEDFQRIIDASTGDLKAQLSVAASLMVKQAEDSKVGSKVTVQAVAVESVTDNSAVVLVSAKSDATGPDDKKPPPAVWRLSVNMVRDGGQLKMSRVDFLR